MRAEGFPGGEPLPACTANAAVAPRWGRQAGPVLRHQLLVLPHPLDLAKLVRPVHSLQVEGIRRCLGVVVVHALIVGGGVGPEAGHVLHALILGGLGQEGGHAVCTPLAFPKNCRHLGLPLPAHGVLGGPVRAGHAAGSAHQPLAWWSAPPPFAAPSRWGVCGRGTHMAEVAATPLLAVRAQCNCQRRGTPGQAWRPARAGLPCVPGLRYHVLPIQRRPRLCRWGLSIQTAAAHHAEPLPFLCTQAAPVAAVVAVRGLPAVEAAEGGRPVVAVCAYARPLG